MILEKMFGTKLETLPLDKLVFFALTPFSKIQK